ncbi:hypothetical protein CAPTEDRAFT_87983, partial [Capitella teleta]
SITMLGPNAFSNFTELTELYLSSNNISFIHDDAFEGVHKLQYLELSFNQLADFPVLRNMPKLTRLFLDNNNIRTIPDDALDLLNLTRVYKLQYLSLSHNQLADLPVLRNMPKLSSLYLDNNNIRTIPDDA